MTDVTRPAPTLLEGERLIVRPFRDEDAPRVYEAISLSREHLQPWFPWVGFHGSLDDTLDFVRNCQAKYLLRQEFTMGMFAGDGSFLGGLGLHVHDWEVPSFEIGHWVRVDAEGNGYVLEAVQLVTACAFDELGAKRLHIRCNARNDRSRRVAERAGFVYEGCQRNFERDTSGNLADILHFSMLPDEYERLRSR